MSTTLPAIYEPRRATAGGTTRVPPLRNASPSSAWERAAYLSGTLSKKRV
jgi:hypothetical protein